VLDKLRTALGLGRAKVCSSGAAPIGAEVLEFFTGLDLNIREVYGQSEDNGPTSVNLPGATKYGTVGKPLPGVEVRLGEDGEILVRGPNVFKGYYKDQPATDACLIDGWLHSGDLGTFDSDGFLLITGRKKEIIITAGGKNIAPKNIEAALKNTRWSRRPSSSATAAPSSAPSSPSTSPPPPSGSPTRARPAPAPCTRTPTCSPSSAASTRPTRSSPASSRSASSGSSRAASPSSTAS
jgi:acyl-CoA synthetase (AMP-forming)/AMP-acid ligase II